MSTLIIGCAVNSTPPSIQYRLAADFRLSSQAAILLRQSDATPNSAPKPLTLGDWGVTSFSKAQPPPGIDHAYDIELRPGASASAYLPTAGELVKFKFSFQPAKRQGHPQSPVEDAYAQAIVDFAGAALVGAINNATAAFTAQATNLNSHIQSAGGNVLQAGQGLGYLTGYPFQVTDGAGGAPSAAPSSGAPSAAGAVVAAQMRAVLGRTPGTGGVQGTLAALDRSFQLVDQNGVDSWQWQPQSYGVSTDVGAGVSGKQASLATFAGSVSDEILPLVDALTALVPENAVNPDEIGASRAIIDDSLPKFVAEMGTDGGPRYTRAKGLLTDVATQLQVLGMLLGALGEQPVGVDLSDPLNWPATGPQPPLMGVLPPIRPFDALNPLTWWPPNEYFVVTVDDERDLTNFRIAFDRLSVLVVQFQTVYQPGALPQDRGMLLVLLQRALDASGEAAQAVLDSLDSVNLGPDERGVIIADPATGLTVEDVLSWAVSFPIDEAAPLLQDGGKLGARSIVTRAGPQGLQGVVALVAGLSAPTGMTHPRVVFALSLLTAALQDVVNAATPLT